MKLGWTSFSSARYKLKWQSDTITPQTERLKWKAQTSYLLLSIFFTLTFLLCLTLGAEFKVPPAGTSMVALPPPPFASDRGFSLYSPHDNPFLCVILPNLSPRIWVLLFVLEFKNWNLKLSLLFLTSFYLIKEMSWFSEWNESCNISKLYILMYMF